MHTFTLDIIIVCDQIMHIRGADHSKVTIQGPIQGFLMKSKTINHFDSMQVTFFIHLIHEWDPLIRTRNLSSAPAWVVPEDKGILIYHFLDSQFVQFIGLPISDQFFITVDKQGIEVTWRRISSHLGTFDQN